MHYAAPTASRVNVELSYDARSGLSALPPELRRLVEQRLSDLAQLASVYPLRPVGLPEMPLATTVQGVRVQYGVSPDERTLIVLRIDRLSPSAPPVPAPGVERTSPPRILLADDDPDSRDIYQESLSNAGYAVIVAKDGDEALQQATEHLPDLVVLDLELPRRDGVSVIRELRGTPATRHLPILLVSAADASCHRAAIEAGADAALQKPCLPMELEAAIRRLLTAHARRPAQAV